ncbi:MAG: ChbG/HpnK family deacetylase [Candidatus Korobacteraceae bacterium]
MASLSTPVNVGLLIVNADDWGRNHEATERTLECVSRRVVSSVSAMVFMEDSERAASIARERGIDAGLHLNFTTPFSARRCPALLVERQHELAKRLLSHRLAHTLFYPALMRSFEYVVSAQLDEFCRIYGAVPGRLDGHHHMHLCPNVLLAGLLPPGTVVRRNFSFWPGEKSLGNRLYRKAVDRILSRRHVLTDFFFSLEPLEPLDRLERIFALADQFVIEVETHPINPAEYRFLSDGEILRLAGDRPIAPRFAVRSNGMSSGDSSLALRTSDVPRLAPEASANETKHICVCICTYKRPQFLKRLLEELGGQETSGLFTYSIVVADNDHLGSAEPVVSDFAATSSVPIRYCVEPQQSIPLARNRAIENAHGDFVALIDDDEFCTERWLLTLIQACNQYGVDGVLGPVKRHFDEEPPKWIVKGNFYERPRYPTGTVVRWPDSRTGNVLVKKYVLAAAEPPFRPEFLSGEDQDFFRRMIEKGYAFIWCDEAVAYEVVPPTRWKRTYMLKKALLRGAVTLVHPTFGARDVITSLIAVPAYTVALPFALILGQHRFMALLVKLCDHLGKVLALLRINPVRELYVPD